MRLADGDGVGPADRAVRRSPRRPSTDVYNQSIPSDGYGYLTTRDGTKLAYTVHPPQDVAERRRASDLPRRAPAGDGAVPRP